LEERDAGSWQPVTCGEALSEGTGALSGVVGLVSKLPTSKTLSDLHMGSCDCRVPQLEVEGQFQLILVYSSKLPPITEH